jgi:hypothetical protein
MYEAIASGHCVYSVLHSLAHASRMRDESHTSSGRRDLPSPEGFHLALPFRLVGECRQKNIKPSSKRLLSRRTATVMSLACCRRETHGRNKPSRKAHKSSFTTFAAPTIRMPHCRLLVPLTPDDMVYVTSTTAARTTTLWSAIDLWFSSLKGRMLSTSRLMPRTVATRRSIVGLSKP